MTARIAMFNHKGGVSKTTTTFHLSWMLAAQGKRVIMVDGDPQCNLTGLVMGYRGPSELEGFYKSAPERNLKAALAPAFESRPRTIEAVECVEIKARPGLFLLPGHIGLSEYEVTLGIAQELSGSIQTLQNLPGAAAFLFEETAKKYNADYLIVDMNPSLSSINQNLMMTSHYFIVPTSPDFFSVMAIDSLASVLPRWQAWSTKANKMPVLTDATYPFPAITPRFLGTVIQKFRPKSGVPAADFLRWIDDIKATVDSKLQPALSACGMMLPASKYSQVGVGNGYSLAEIGDFNTLIAKSQSQRTPVFALNKKQLGQSGRILQTTTQARNKFRKAFADLAHKIADLTQ